MLVARLTINTGTAATRFHDERDILAAYAARSRSRAASGL
jgi:hypothetical protein